APPVGVVGVAAGPPRCGAAPGAGATPGPPPTLMGLPLMERLARAQTGLTDFEGWQPRTTLSLNLMVSLVHPRFLSAAGVERNSAPHFTTCPFSSVTSKNSDGWG